MFGLVFFFGGGRDNVNVWSSFLLFLMGGGGINVNVWCFRGLRRDRDQ